MEIIKKRLFFHTSSWWHSLPSMQYINRWKLFLMCHCLSKMRIGSTNEMTSTWRCQLYHMAVSLAIKKNWQARIAVVSAEELIFLLQSLILHNLTHFVVMKSGDLAEGRQGLLEHLAGLSSSRPGLLLCRPSCCAAGLARTHGQTCTFGVRVLHFEPEGFRPCIDPCAEILCAHFSSELWATVVFVFLKHCF